ncbi:MAG TPA: hypothetical protein VFE33_23000 [Thermoanaerobaculia bacterium]|nr:hypothetical protein [Thermoanaerobaculia bacterium]
MPMKMKGLVLTVLLGTLALPALAATGGSSAPASPDANTAYGLLDHPRALAKFLHLSADQTTQLLAFWNTFQTAVQPLHQARPALCQQLRTDLAVTPPNPTTVGTDVLALVDNRDDVHTARQAFDTSFSAILTPDQLTRYDTLKRIAHLDNGPGTDLLGDCPPAAS